MRSNRSKSSDYGKKAKKTYNAQTLTREQYYKWQKNPAQLDIRGVDTPGSKPTTMKKNDSKFTIFDIEVM
jgi:hypothetical protein